MCKRVPCESATVRRSGVGAGLCHLPQPGCCAALCRWERPQHATRAMQPGACEVRLQPKSAISSHLERENKTQVPHTATALPASRNRVGPSKTAPRRQY